MFKTLINNISRLFSDSEKKSDEFLNFKVPSLKDAGVDNIKFTESKIRAWQQREDIKKVLLKSNIYVMPSKRAGKITYSYTDILKSIVDRYKAKVPQYRFSTMTMLNRMFYYEDKNQWFYFLVGYHTYSEIKCLFLYAVIEDMLSNKMPARKIIKFIFESFGLETHNILFNAFGNFITMAEIMALKEEVISRRANSGYLELFKDKPFDDTFVKTWEWLTLERSSDTNSRFNISNPLEPRTRMSFIKSSQSPESDKRITEMIKPTSEGVQMANTYILESIESSNLERKRQKLQELETVKMNEHIDLKKANKLAQEKKAKLAQEKKAKLARKKEINAMDRAVKSKIIREKKAKKPK